MSYEKQNFASGQILKAEHLNHMEDGIGANDAAVAALSEEINNIPDPPDVSAFITRAVNDLENYYRKDETYTREEIDGRISAIPKFSIAVVYALPTDVISETTIYLVPGGVDGNLYTEYIYVNGTWEILGSQRVDLTGYATQTWTLQQLAGYQPKGNYLTEHQDISGKLDANKLPEAVNTALEQAKASGEFDGQPGADGSDGADGNGIKSAVLNANYTLTLTFDDGTSYTTPSIRGATGATGSQGPVGNDGYTPVRGVDYYTEADKAEFSEYIAGELAKRGQLKPEFANSIEECTDQSKLYVLPDGYIYAYVLTATEGGVVPNFTNLMDDPRAYIKKGYRYSHSNAAFKDCTTDCAIVIPIPSTAGPFTVRVKEATISGSSYSGSAYFGTDGQTFSGNNDISKFSFSDDGNGTVTFTQKAYDGGFNYFVVHVYNNIDESSLIVTLNEEITYTTTGDDLAYQWANTGHAFVPADYEERIIALETSADDHESRIAYIEEHGAKSSGVSLEYNTCSIFRKVVCCGDSFTCGYIGTATDNIVGENYDFAWPSFMARLTGNEYVNCGHSGKNVWTWQASEKGLAKAQSAGRAQAYLIGLGLNDSAQLEIGTASDIGTENQTYYGGLSKLIRELNAISPTAKIFVQTIPSDYVVYAQFNEAMRNVVSAYAETYPVHLLDLYQFKTLYKTAKVNGDSSLGHYTPIGYQQFAENLRYVWSDYINSHIPEFQDVYLIPYDATPEDLDG